MDYSLFSKVINNVVIRKFIFNNIQIYHSEILLVKPLKWNFILNNVSILIQYNYIPQLREYLNKYIENRLSNNDKILNNSKLSIVFHGVIRLSIENLRFEILQMLIDDFKINFTDHIDCKTMLKSASKAGSIEMIQYLYGKFNFTLPDDYIDAFDNAQNVKVLQWIYDQFNNDASLDSLYELDNYLVFKNHLYDGHSDEINWLIVNKFTIDKSNLEDFIICSLNNGDFKSCFELMKYNEKTSDPIDTRDLTISDNWLFSENPLECLEFIQSHGIKVSYSHSSIGRASALDNLELIQWLYAVSPEQRDYSGKLGVIEWVYEDNDTLELDGIINNAAINGNLDILEWCHKIDSTTISTSPNAMEDAAANGNFSVVRWLHQLNPIGCISKAINSAAVFGHWEIFKWLCLRTEQYEINAMEMAAKQGRLDIIKWLHENRSENPTYEAILDATKENQIDCLRWLLENSLTEEKKDYYQQAIYFAIENNNIEMVKLLHKNVLGNCDLHAPYFAALNNNFELFSYLLEEVLSNHFNQQIKPLEIPAKCNGNTYEMFKYYYELDNGSSIDNNVFSYIIKVEHFDIFKQFYREESNCFTQERHLIEIVDQYNVEAIRLLMKKHYQWSRNILENAYQNDQFETAELLLEYTPIDTIIHRYRRKSNTPLLNLYLNNLNK